MISTLHVMWQSHVYSSKYLPTQIYFGFRNWKDCKSAHPRMARTKKVHSNACADSIARAKNLAQTHCNAFVDALVFHIRKQGRLTRVSGVFTSFNGCECTRASKRSLQFCPLTGVPEKKKIPNPRNT